MTAFHPAGCDLVALAGSPLSLTPVPYAYLNERGEEILSYIPTEVMTFWAGGIIAKLNNQHPSFMWDTGANRSGTSGKTYLRMLFLVSKSQFKELLDPQSLHP